MTCLVELQRAKDKWPSYSFQRGKVGCIQTGQNSAASSVTETGTWGQYHSSKGQVVSTTLQQSQTDYQRRNEVGSNRHGLRGVPSTHQHQ